MATGVAFVICAAILPLGQARAEAMTARMLADRIADADDPCQTSYERALDEWDRTSRAGELARAAERTCRSGAEALGRITLTPSADRDLAAMMRDALAACTGALRLRADRLTRLAADPPDAALREELGQAEESCREAFERIAQP